MKTLERTEIDVWGQLWPRNINTPRKLWLKLDNIKVIIKYLGMGTMCKEYLNLLYFIYLPTTCIIEKNSNRVKSTSWPINFEQQTTCPFVYLS